MTFGFDRRSYSTLSPDKAFAALGNETRTEILRTLGESDGGVSFTDLRKRVGLSPGSEFNYHLEQLTGHFVRQTDQRYEFWQPGTPIVEAVLSGVITEDPTLAPKEIDLSCQLCGATTIVSYREGWVALFCTECDGFYGPPRDDFPTPPEVSEYGYLGGYFLPPAGLEGRGASDLFEAATTWSMSKMLSHSKGVCMRCSAPVDVSAHVCEDHDESDPFCEECNHRYAVQVSISCTNCLFSEGGLLAHLVISNTEVLCFLTSHGINPVSPPGELYEILSTHDEEVLSVDPLKVRLRFTINDDAITVTVGENLSVTDTTKERISDER